MSKPLSIEELKALEVGDWVWVESETYGKTYAIIEDSIQDGILVSAISLFGWLNYPFYGTKWLAYKNKEMAEANGEIVELHCKVGDKIYVPWIWDDSDGIMNLTVTSITLRNNGIDYFCNILETDDINFAKQFDLGNFHSTDYNSIWFTDKSESERRLAELKGEKE